MGIQFAKQHGQHFLVDDLVLDKIEKTTRIKPEQNILEIGPGLGVLTQRLVKSKSNIVAVEFDNNLVPYIKKQFNSAENINIIQSDILKLSNKTISEFFSDKPYRVISNIPYYITGKIIKKFISTDTPKPTDMALLVQKEVAKRICSNVPNMSLLSLSVQLYSKPSIGFEVSKQSFFPVPEVDSALLLIKEINEKPIHSVNEERFWQVARIGFASPRKQLRNNLANGLHVSQDFVKQAIIHAKLKQTVRAQELGISDWISLICALEEK